jgi:hypothetical protein
MPKAVMSEPPSDALPHGFAARPLSYPALFMWAAFGACLGGALWQLAL